MQQRCRRRLGRSQYQVDVGETRIQETAIFRSHGSYQWVSPGSTLGVSKEVDGVCNSVWPVRMEPRSDGPNGGTVIFSKGDDDYGLGRHTDEGSGGLFGRLHRFRHHKGRVFDSTWDTP